MEAHLALQQRIRELERENEELKQKAAAHSETYPKTSVDDAMGLYRKAVEGRRELRGALREARAAAITPEMRERIRHLLRISDNKAVGGESIAFNACRILRDLLGEQG